MKLKLDLDYKRLEEEKKKTSNIALTEDYINYSIIQAYKEGIDGQLKRIVARLQRKLEDAVLNNTPEIEIEEAELDIIKKSFEKVKTPVQLIKYWIILEDEIDSLKND